MTTRQLKEQSVDAGIAFARIASLRLKLLLDELGEPRELLARSSLVAERMQVTLQAAQQILSGQVAWTWQQLAKACEVYEREPGYFLDERPGGLPSDAVLVPGADGGESIVWRAPSGFLKAGYPSRAQLRYLTEHHRDGTYPPGSLIIFAELGATPEQVQPGASYVVESERGLEPMRCVEARGHRVSLESERARGLGCVLEHPAREGTDRILGRVIATIRPV